MEEKDWKNHVPMQMVTWSSKGAWRSGCWPATGLSPRTWQPEEGRGLHGAQCGQEGDHRAAGQGARTAHALSEHGLEARLSAAAAGARLPALGRLVAVGADLWLHLWAGEG